MNRRSFIATSAAFAALPSITSCSRDRGTPSLTIYTWTDYLKPGVKKKFEESHDCKVIIETFESNEAMLSNLASGASGYDLLVPSSYAVQALKSRGKLQPLDHQKIPNLKNIDPDYLSKAVDPKMEVSVPYMAAPTCLAYLRSKVSDAKPSWNLFNRPDLKGHVSLLDARREVLGAALKALGYSLNSIDPLELSKAGDLVLEWKKNISGFENEKYKANLVSGESYLVQGYAGDLLKVADENGDIHVVVPEEGTAFNCDDLCIPKDAQNVSLAHQFIDFLCIPEIAAENMELIGFRAPNAAAYSHLTEDFRGSEVLFPPAEIFAKCEPVKYLGDHLPLWKKEWDRVKAS